jgi:hypothetical protein
VAEKRKREADNALERERKVREESAQQAKTIQELETQKARDAAELAKFRAAKATMQKLKEHEQQDPNVKMRGGLQQKADGLREALQALSDLETNRQVTPAALLELNAPSRLRNKQASQAWGPCLTCLLPVSL